MPSNGARGPASRTSRTSWRSPRSLGRGVAMRTRRSRRCCTTPVEDQGGAARLVDIRARFGDAVAAIVAGCTAEEFPEWRATKEAYLARLAVASPAVLCVSSADKAHNARDPGRSPAAGRCPPGALRRRQGGDTLVLPGTRRVSAEGRWPAGRCAGTRRRAARGVSRGGVSGARRVDTHGAKNARASLARALAGTP